MKHLLLSLALLPVLCLPMAALAQPAQLSYHMEPYTLDTGLHSAPPSETAPQVVYSAVVEVPDAPWLRLNFSDANLGSSSYITVTSLYDEARQDLNAAAIAQWQNTSAYFNGDALKVELYAAPGDQAIFVQMDEIMVGEHGAPLGPPQGQCGDTDDRVPSSDDRMGRLVDFVCTAFLIGDGSLVTAGHCILDPDLADTVQFNVPASLPSGAIQHPGPEDQYAIDNSSRVGAQGAVGEDWGVFETFANTTTGLTPIQAQGTFFNLVQDLGPPMLRVTGYGLDDGTANHTQQTHAGANDGSSGTTLRFLVDMAGGSSGSPVIDDANDDAVGVATHGACTTVGYNVGTSASHPDFWAVVGNVPYVGYELCDTQSEDLFLAVEDGSADYGVKVYDSSGTLIHNSGLLTTPIRGNCYWIAETSGDVPGPQTIVELPPGEVYTIDVFSDGTESGRFTYFVCDSNPGASPEGFFCPNGDQAGASQASFLVASGGSLHAVPEPVRQEFGGPGEPAGVGDFFTGEKEDLWVLPYNLDVACEQITCDPDFLDWNVFVTPQNSPTNTPLAMDFTFVEDLTVDAADTWRWYMGGNAVRFFHGTLLTVNGVLDADDVLFTELNNGQGWGGMTFTSGSNGTLTDVTVEEVTCSEVCKGYAAVRTYSGGALTLEGTHISNNDVSGLNVASGSSTDPVVVTDNGPSSPSEISNNTGFGVIVVSGGDVLIEEGTRITDNGKSGVLARGTASFAWLHNARIQDNDGVGVYAQNYAAVFFDRYFPPDPDAETTMSGNEGGGLYAQTYSVIQAGWYSGGACTGYCNNTISDHYQDGGGTAPYDAKASVGSLLNARWDFWGEDGQGNPITLESQLGLDEDGSSIIEVDPLQTTTPSARTAGAPLARIELQSEGHRGGDRSPVQQAILEAYDAAANGDHSAAYGLLRAALAGASTDEDRAIAFATAAHFLGERDDPATIAVLEAFTHGDGNPRRPWALQTLASVYTAQGLVEAARSVAATLAADYPETEHTLYAFSTLVHLAVETDDQAAALTALAGLQTAWPEEGLTEDAEALVAAAGWGAESARSTNPEMMTAAQTRTETSPVGGFRLMAAYPNPFNPIAVVPFELNQSGHVTLTVYDVLGREIAILVDGFREAGYHSTTFDGTQLASGMYFLRALVELEGGARSIIRQQITLLK